MNFHPDFGDTLKPFASNATYHLARIGGSAVATLLLSLGSAARAQVTRAEFTNALGKNAVYRKAAGPQPGAARWIDGTSSVWFDETDGTANTYVLFNAQTQKRVTLDNVRIAAALSRNDPKPMEPGELELTALLFEAGAHAFTFHLRQDIWRCTLPAYACEVSGHLPDSEDWSKAPEFEGNDPHRPVTSPDGRWEATIQNFNVFLRPAKSDKPASALSTDGSEGNYYQHDTLQWSPDSKHLLAIRVLPGMRRQVQYVSSSPEYQLQPVSSTRFYAKPGDVLDREQPVLFDPETGKQTAVSAELFPNPFELSGFEWRKDSSAFTFLDNERGHQRLAVLSVDAVSGVARRIIDETSTTYIEYTELHPEAQGTGKFYRHDIDDGAEILWLSERDGWAHLYLYDGRSGILKNQVTHGEWVVRGVDRVDESKRQIYFQASGVDAKLDPYFTQGYRINFDGSGMIPMTTAPANHQLSYSQDGAYYVDRFSRVDMAPELDLKRTSDQSMVTTLAKGDLTKLKAAGWQPPEVFVAKGRDGKTDIWGLIWRPAHFDATKHYPVVEDIYAGPQGSFVPKNFSPRAQPLTELGFVVVQMDGMGTNNRSKAFHDVIWKNLKDGGFEDRILWHQAAAAKFPWYDATRVGIFGTSAGGQNALGALLFHPDFYKAAVANSGSHDNRMDKIWWNEQWMGWPVGPEYAASSNVVNAGRLQGKLLLVMGELDTNVDPSTTLQVANALIKADKDFELLDVPGGGHGAGGRYGERRLMDFFVRALTDEKTPNWNETAAAK
jgi:dipeptidyl aminopeptidase/acylaminoacyl peptidase